MRILEDSICRFCQGVFCCAQCRHKHEIKNHAIVVRKPIMISTGLGSSSAATTSVGQHNAAVDGSSGAKLTADQASFETIYLFCPICAKQPLPLQADLHHELLVHVETHHLPLRCDKCMKLYYNVSDLKEFSKCMRPNAKCTSQEPVATNQSNQSSCITDDASKITVTKAFSSTHNSPMRRMDFNDSHVTPISIINMRWKAKSNRTSQEELVSDSLSSIKNISSINNSSIHRRSTGLAAAPKGKVIRSTSTPVHLEMVFAKPKDQTFIGHGCGHISSIRYNSACESDTSPALAHPSSSQALEPMNRYFKASGARPKMTSVTPLRQVMSKSIQKAFAEHGLPSVSKSIRPEGSSAFQRKKIFDNTESPCKDTENTREIKNMSPGPPALDLRLSPAVRRSQSKSENSILPEVSNDEEQRGDHCDVQNLQRNVLLAAQKLTTESIVITRTEHMSSVSSTNSALNSNGSLNSLKPHTSTNSSYESATSNNSRGSVFKSCSSSVEIITATTEKIEHVQSVESVVKQNRLQLPPPITPNTRIPGAIIHKKVIKFETPKVEPGDSRYSMTSPADVFFTPYSTPISNSSCELERSENSVEKHKRQIAVKQNLNGRFSHLEKPFLKDCAHSKAFNRIENLSTGTFEGHEGNSDCEDDVFIGETKKERLDDAKEIKKPKQTQNAGGLWSIMSSVMRKGSFSKSPWNKETSLVIEKNSKSLIKRCASIAGSLVRAKPLMDAKEVQAQKRKRTYTMDEQTSSAFLNELNKSDATSPNSDCMNTSSKRFRIQGRRPINRMRFDS